MENIFLTSLSEYRNLYQLRWGVCMVSCYAIPFLEGLHANCRSMSKWVTRLWSCKWHENTRFNHSMAPKELYKQSWWADVSLLLVTKIHQWCKYHFVKVICNKWKYNNHNSFEFYLLLLMNKLLLTNQNLSFFLLKMLMFKDGWFPIGHQPTWLSLQFPPTLVGPCGILPS